MKEHVYKINQWRLAQALNPVQITEVEPEPEDQTVRRYLQTRQVKLYTFGDSEALIQHARANLLRQASAEINAVMDELNGVHLTEEEFGEIENEPAEDIPEFEFELWIEI